MKPDPLAPHASRGNGASVVPAGPGGVAGRAGVVPGRFVAPPPARCAGTLPRKAVEGRRAATEGIEGCWRLAMGRPSARRAPRTARTSGLAQPWPARSQAAGGGARRLRARTKCGRRDLNPHGLRHWNLNPACLPFHHARITGHASAGAPQGQQMRQPAPPVESPAHAISRPAAPPRRHRGWHPHPARIPGRGRGCPRPARSGPHQVARLAGRAPRPSRHGPPGVRPAR